MANITESIGLTSQDINVAVSFIKMEVFDTLLTFLAIQREFTTASDSQGLSADK